MVKSTKIRIPRQLLIGFILVSTNAGAQVDQSEVEQLEANKQVAMGFYRDPWATDNTDRYSDYVADTLMSSTTLAIGRASRSRRSSRRSSPIASGTAVRWTSTWWLLAGPGTTSLKA